MERRAACGEPVSLCGTPFRVSGAGSADAGKICVETRVYAPDGKLCAETKAAQKEPVTWARDGEQTFVQRLEISAPELWSADSPALYKAEVIVWKDGEKQDEISVPAGIRSVAFDCSQGFLINGKREKLNGVCVHHDGGSK